MMDQISPHLPNKISILIFDYEDSFTYNIASSFLELGEVSLVVKLKDHQAYFDYLLNFKQRNIVLVLGPGPGHPSDYQNELSYLSKIFSKKNIYTFGICLGHQLIWLARGHKVVEAKTKLHGKVQRSSSTLFSELGIQAPFSYQRYNSLEIELKSHLLKVNEEVFFEGQSFLWAKFPQGISYQFHPESVGTSCPELFFRPALNFLYNRKDEFPSDPQRFIRSKTF